MKKSIIALAILSTMSATTSADIDDIKYRYNMEIQGCYHLYHDTRESSMFMPTEEEVLRVREELQTCKDHSETKYQSALYVETHTPVTSPLDRYNIDIRMCENTRYFGSNSFPTVEEHAQLEEEFQACKSQASIVYQDTLDAVDAAEEERINNLPPIEVVNSARRCFSKWHDGSYGMSTIIEDGKVSYQSFHFNGGEFYSSSQSSKMISQSLDLGKFKYDIRMNFEGVELEFFNAQPGSDSQLLYVYAEADGKNTGHMEEYLTCTSEATHEESVRVILAYGIIKLADLGNQDISAEALLSNHENRAFYGLGHDYFYGPRVPGPSAFALSIAAKRVLGSYPRELTLDEKILLDDTITQKLLYNSNYTWDDGFPTNIIVPAVEIEVEVDADAARAPAPADEGGNGSMGLLLMFLPLIRKIIK